MSVLVSNSAKGATTTDITITDLPDDIVAALDAIAERCAMSRDDFIRAIVCREARTPWRITEEERREGLARLADLRPDSTDD